MFNRTEERKTPTAEQKNSDPGYDPLEYREGEFYVPGGGLVKPAFLVGPEEWHRQLFIEYERTFGRGNAFNITHPHMGSIPDDKEARKRFFEKYGEDVRTEYYKLTSVVGLMARGTREECEASVQKLLEYRQSHPALYEDKPDRSRPKKKFEITNKDTK